MRETNFIFGTWECYFLLVIFMSQVIGQLRAQTRLWWQEDLVSILTLLLIICVTSGTLHNLLSIGSLSEVESNKFILQS